MCVGALVMLVRVEKQLSVNGSYNCIYHEAVYSLGMEAIDEETNHPIKG
jgi:hypothetical protein